MLLKIIDENVKSTATLVLELQYNNDNRLIENLVYGIIYYFYLIFGSFSQILETLLRTRKKTFFF